jgi:mannose-1-phosphate guanylyltransferase / mannose-6-phosphate isomerase
MAIIRPVILCGGAGVRLWPASRETMPKQFAPICGPRSMFQETVLRVMQWGLDCPLVVTNQMHRPIAERQLGEIEVKADVLLEPVRRDSGPAIAAACVTLMREQPGAIALVLAADHVMSDPESFRDAVSDGTHAAMIGHLITFAVEPTYPETGYGYIEPGTSLQGRARAVSRFAEKPSAEKAAEYVRAGMLWNSGNFLFRADALLDEYRKFDAATVSAVETAYRNGRVEHGARILSADYERSTSKSIDYAVMEKTNRAAVVSVSCGWSDIGSWNSLYSFGSKNGSGNVVNGNAELIDSHGCLVATDGPLATLIGMENVVVVANDGAILVTERRRSGEVKNLVEALRRQGRNEADTNSCVYRPWGSYRITDVGAGFQVKRIVVNPGGRLSLQKHRYRAEHWVVVKGQASVTIGDQVNVLGPNEHACIPLGAVHRLENFGNVPVELVEVQCGSYLGEDDIVRLEDIYNRMTPVIDGAEGASGPQHQEAVP